MDKIIWSMQYTIYSLMKKHEHFMFFKKCLRNVLVLWCNQKIPKKLTFECESNHFVYDSIWLNMMYIIEKWCFEVISIITKPGKHSKYNEIWRNNFEKNENGQKNLVFSISTLRNDALQSSKFACTDFLMSRIRIWCQNLKIITILYNFNDFPKVDVDMFFDFWNKTEIATENRFIW